MRAREGLCLHMEMAEGLIWGRKRTWPTFRLLGGSVAFGGPGEDRRRAWKWTSWGRGGAWAYPLSDHALSRDHRVPFDRRSASKRRGIRLVNVSTTTSTIPSLPRDENRASSAFQ